MEVDLKGVFRIARKWVLTIVLLAVVAGTTVGYYSSHYIEKQYEASTKVIVNNTKTIEGVQDLSLNNLNAQIQLIATYKEVVKTPWMMGDVINKHPELKLTESQLTDKIKVSSVHDTQIMTFTARDKSYANAAAIVNAVTDEFVVKVPGLMKIDNVTVLNRADLFDAPGPVTPDTQLNIMIAVVLALIIGMGAAFLSEHLDSSIKSEEAVHEYLGLPTLAVIGRIKATDLRSSKIDRIGKAEKAGDPGYAAANQ